MANVIEILLAAKDQASAAIARVQGSMTGLNTVLGAFGGPAMLGAVGMTSLSAAAAGAVLSVKHLAAEAEHLSNIAQQTGVSIDAIQEIGITFERAGLSAMDAAQALKFLNKAIADQSPLLAQLGVTSHDTETAFLQLADSFRAHVDSPGKVAAALQLLGRAGNVAIPVMNQGSESFKRMAEEGRRTGEILNVKLIGPLMALDAQFDRLQGEIDGLKKTLAALAAPLATVVIKSIHQMAIELQAVAQFAGLAAVSIGAVIGIVDPKRMAEALGHLEDLGKQFAALNDVATVAKTPRGDAEVLLPGTGMSLAQFREAIGLLERFPDTSSAAFGVQGFRGKQVLKPDTLLDVPKAVLDSKTRALEDFRRAMNDITDAGSIMADSLNEGFNALASGFRGVFESLLTGAGSFSDAMRNLFRGLVDAILSELARLAAAAIFNTILGIITGGLGGGIPNLPGVISGKLYGVAPALPERTLRGAPSSGNTYIINAIDARDVVMALMSPGGSMRRANDRIAIGAAY